MASAYQNSHNIAQQVWNEFGQDLRRLGFRKSDFSFVNNYAAGMPNISRLPKIGQINGPSGHFGWDRAHATAWQATREYISAVLENKAQGNTSFGQARSQILALRSGLSQGVSRGRLALSIKDQKFLQWSGDRLLARNRQVLARIGRNAPTPVIPNTRLAPLNPRTLAPAKSGYLFNAYNKLAASTPTPARSASCSPRSTGWLRTVRSKGWVRSVWCLG